MMHETALITTIVAGLVLAFVFGAIANRLKLPPLVGYLLAGVVVGPYSPGFVADASLASQLAEIGVILLMFGVGLNFSLKDLLSVQAVAIPGAIGRIIGGTALGVGLALLLGWSIWAGLIFGLALSVASTVVLLKALQDRHLIDTDRGRIAVGWVIVEDIVMILALVLIPTFATVMGGTAEPLNDPFVSLVERLLRTDVGVWGVLAITLVKLAAFVGVMLVVGRRVIPLILHYTAHTGSRELFRLAVLSVALGVAAGASYLFGVSLALGAFFAGMILSESELSHRAAQESLPLRDAFAVLFFVSVGMLFDPAILITNPLPLLGTLFIIVIGKSIFAYLLVIAFRRPASTALITAAGLAQIGEFSFILAALGVSLGVLPPEGRDLILGGAILSIIINPLLFWGANRLKPWLDARHATHPGDATPAEPVVDGAMATAEMPTADGAVAAATAPAATEDDEVHPTTLGNHTILAGYGRVGRVIGEGLAATRAKFLVIEDADARIAAAHAAGIEVVIGNAASHRVLELANIAGARTLILALPNVFEAGQATEQARRVNPSIRIIARAHSDEEEEHLTHLGADIVVRGEREIGLGMFSLVKDEVSQGAESATGEIVPSVAPVPEPEAPKLAPAENILAAAIPAAGAAAMGAETLSAAPPMLPEPGGEGVETAEPIALDTPSASYTEADDLETIGLEPSASRAETSPEVAPPPPESEVAAANGATDTADESPAPAEAIEEPVVGEPARAIEDASAVAGEPAPPIEPAAEPASAVEPEPEAAIAPDPEPEIVAEPAPDLPPIAAGPVIDQPVAPAVESERQLEQAAMAAIESNRGASEDWIYDEAEPPIGESIVAEADAPAAEAIAQEAAPEAEVEPEDEAAPAPESQFSIPDESGGVTPSPALPGGDGPENAPDPTASYPVPSVDPEPR